jgi:hypothetical protein
MSVYAHKNFLVHVNRVEEEGTVQTQSGVLPVFVGDILTTDEYGNTTVMNERYFLDNYVEVEKVKPKQRKRKVSPFEQEYTKQLMEFGCLESNVEDQEYISGQMELTKNKAF